MGWESSTSRPISSKVTRTNPNQRMAVENYEEHHGSVVVMIESEQTASAQARSSTHVPFVSLLARRLKGARAPSDQAEISLLTS